MLKFKSFEQFVFEMDMSNEKNSYNDSLSHAIIEKKQKKYYNDRDKWEKDRRKLDVIDDEENKSIGPDGELNSFWNANRGEGWIQESVDEHILNEGWFDIITQGSLVLTSALWAIQGYMGKSISDVSLKGLWSKIKRDWKYLKNPELKKLVIKLAKDPEILKAAEEKVTGPKGGKKPQYMSDDAFQKVLLSKLTRAEMDLLRYSEFGIPGTTQKGFKDFMANNPIDENNESVNEAKTITVKFDGDSQTLHFSDGQKSKVDYDGQFKYKGKWFDTGDMEEPEDLEKMLSNAFPGTKFIQTESLDIVTKELNEIKLSDLVGKDYKYVIGSSEEKKLSADENYVLDKIQNSLTHYLYDSNFALNYLNDSQQIKYDSFFENHILTPMLKEVDFTLNNFFTIDNDKVKWKLSSDDTEKLVDEIFKKNSKISEDIKNEYYDYRLNYAGVKLNESINETSQPQGEAVVFLKKNDGSKELLMVKSTWRAATMFLKKNADRLLDNPDVDRIGVMTKKNWDMNEAKDIYARLETKLNDIDVV